MKSDLKILKSTLQGIKQERVPFWFMRQAGRYLPEYRELRAKTKNFLEFCYSPEIACEATLQPIRRFGMDGAIIFSDILVVPHALGAEVWFAEGEGPRLVPVKEKKALGALSLQAVTEKLQPVYKALTMVKAELPKETTLIGFAGSPWTLACYMVEGQSSKTFSEVKLLAKESPVFFDGLLALLADAVILHCGNQIEAGAEVIQLFDSWAGVLGDEEFLQYVIAPTRKIVAALSKKYPHIPVIGFPRQAGMKYALYAKETGVNALSFDQTVPLEWVRDKLQPQVVVQGCLNQNLLADDKAAMLAEAKAIMEVLSDKPFVFNLAHGILPHTPPEHMQALCDYLKNAAV